MSRDMHLVFNPQAGPGKGDKHDTNAKRQQKGAGNKAKVAKQKGAGKGAGGTLTTTATNIKLGQPATVSNKKGQDRKEQRKENLLLLLQPKRMH